MLDLEPEVEAEYQRFSSQYDSNPHFGPPCLSVDDVLRAHFLIANHFLLEGEGIGGIGPKDKSLLESAVFRQVSSFRGQQKWNNLFDITATLFFGIIKNHAFHDANKRTAFLTALLQLYRGGYCPSTSEKVLEDFTVDVADSKLSKFSRYRDFIKNGTPDPEVRMISKFFRDNTRKLDSKRYVVTFRELQKILNRYDYYLENPDDNRIDVVKYIEKKRFLGLGKVQQERVRVGRIGFPRWTAQVLPSDIKAVRDMTGLTHKNGVDSGAFYHNLDDMQSLITTYNEPLMRLAYR